MSWPFYQKRGPQWKHGWTERSLSSLSLPPFPLIAIFAILIFFIYISSHIDYKNIERRTEEGFRIFLILLVVLLLFVVRYVLCDGLSLFTSFRMPYWYERRSVHHRPGLFGSSFSIPWGMIVVVVLLLVMVSYQSYFHSKWFRPFWYQYDY
ncbi:hypothetical protein LUZ60_002428 [Juncus effusus]|nr:hypothetical protein LUZ60_002428 [Juncus effusus]